MELMKLNVAKHEMVCTWAFYQSAIARDFQFSEPNQDFGWMLRSDSSNALMKKWLDCEITQLSLTRIVDK